MNLFNIRLPATILKTNPINIKNDCIAQTNHSPDRFSQANSNCYNLLVNKAIYRSSHPEGFLVKGVLGSFETKIDKSTKLNNVEKFNYLRSWLNRDVLKYRKAFINRQQLQ